MSKSFSIYLDCLRIIAAFGVLVVHLGNPLIASTPIIDDERGQNFVVLFFVLSGFLIAYSSEKKSSIQAFLIDRIAKFSTVVIPALSFTFLLFCIGSYFYSFTYSNFNSSHLGFKFVVNFLYLSQSWNLCSIPPTNPSFWSLSYEFWYYIIFAIIYFLQGYKKWLLLTLAVFIAGFKIMLLFPVWLLGAAAYYIVLKIKWLQWYSIVIFMLTSLMLIYFVFIFPTNYFQIYARGIPPLFYSASFLSDFCLGVLLVLNMLSFSQIKINLQWANFSDLLKRVAGHTFSLYLFHFPSILFLSSAINYNKSSWLHIAGLGLIAYIFSALISNTLEKTRKYYKALFISVTDIIFTKELH